MGRSTSAPGCRFGPGGLTDEIGDKCVGVYGPFNAKGADIYIKGHPYVLQEEWDNATSGCSVGLDAAFGKK